MNETAQEIKEKRIRKERDDSFSLLQDVKKRYLRAVADYEKAFGACPPVKEFMPNIRSVGEIIGIDKRYDSVCLSIILLPEEMKNPEEMFEYRIGDKVKVMGNESPK